MVKTDKLVELVGEDGLGSFADNVPLGRVGDVVEIAATAAFFASDDSSFMTGSEVFVDGGFAQV